MTDKTSRTGNDLQQTGDRFRPFSDAPEFAGIRVLVVARDALEREGIRALLAAWGCETQGARNDAPLLPAAPDVLIVVAPNETETAGAAAVAALRERYGRAIPAILIVEPGHRRRSAAGHREYTPLKPDFTAAQLRAALAGLKLQTGPSGQARNSEE